MIGGLTEKSVCWFSQLDKSWIEKEATSNIKSSKWRIDGGGGSGGGDGGSVVLLTATTTEFEHISGFITS